MMKRLAGLAAAASIAFFGSGVDTAKSETYWQCVTFARMLSGVQIFGDAWTWWQKAGGRYAQGDRPEAGAVLVFKPHGRMNLGHVAVVSQVLTDRIVQVDHANWGGSRGKVEEAVTVVDVSPAGDWTSVKVWYNPIGDLGTTVYPTYGFIYQNTVGAGVAVADAAARPAAQESIAP